MRIVRFADDDQAQWGVLEADEVAVLAGAPWHGIRRTGRRRPAAQCTFLAPVEPPNLIAIGTNYRPHVAETNAPLPERPLVFLKATTSIIAPEAPIERPRMAPHEVDYEAELAIVIGKPARHVSRESALDVVFGYTCANDVTARDCQRRHDRQWARAKSFDTFCPLGPWIETDLDPDNLRVRSRLNGTVMQDATTATMIFDCRTLISYLSEIMTLLPGTVILTGTPGGVGMARTPEVFLQPGDRIEVEVEGIGLLGNPVVDEP